MAERAAPNGSIPLRTEDIVRLKIGHAHPFREVLVKDFPLRSDWLTCGIAVGFTRIRLRKSARDARAKPLFLKSNILMVNFK